MKKLSVLACTAIVMAASVPSLFAGDVTGKITLKGTPPAEKVIQFDETCGPMHTGTTTTRHYVVGKDNGLANVFVYVSKGLEGKTFKAPTTPVVLDQKGCMYEPYVQGMMVGQTLQIKNSDPILHNIHAMESVSGADLFNVPQPTQNQVNEKKFDKPEIMVKFKCDVHQWMFAYIGVLDHPFFATTDKDGNYKITGLPPGEYTLTAYHQKTHGVKPGLTQTIKVEGDKPVTADFTVEVPAS